MNGFRVGEDFSYKAKVEYFCNPGFRLTAGTRLRHCQLNKKWSGTLPTCEGNYAGKVIYSKTSQWYARGASRKFHFKAKSICLRILIFVCKIGTPPWTTCRFVLVDWFNKKSIRSTALHFCIIESVYKDRNKQKMFGLFCEKMVLNSLLHPPIWKGTNEISTKYHYNSWKTNNWLVTFN